MTTFYILAWFPMVLIAVLNGALRELVLRRRFVELRAHQLSCATGIFLFTIYTWALNLRWPLQSHGQALKIGVAWVAMTVAFEFTFGRLAFRRSWRELFQEYNLAAGRLWVLVLLAVALLPEIIFFLP